MKFLKCAICENGQKLEEKYKANFDIVAVNEQTFSARRTTDNVHYQINECKNCGLIFSSPILEDHKIESFYAKSKFNYSQEAEYLKDTYRFYFEKYILKKKKNLKVLDVGCGNGFFLDAIKSAGLTDLYGVEPSADAVKKAPQYLKKRIKIGVLKEKLYPQSFFDSVCCLHTLDHVVDPNKFIKTVRKILKKNGTIFFIVHDTDGMSVKLFKEKSPIFDIEHIYLFNKDNLRKIFLKNGFRKARVFNVKNKYPLSYWLRMSPIPKLIKKPIINFAKITKIGNIPLEISAGNIGIIAYR